MKNNWTQILVFVILSLIIGFTLGRITGKKGHHGEKHIEKRIMMKDGDHAENMSWHDDELGMTMEFEDDGEVETIVASLEENGFIGDTVFSVNGAEVRVNRTGDEVSVEVEREMDKDQEEGKRIKKIIKKDGLED